MFNYDLLGNRLMVTDGLNSVTRGYTPNNVNEGRREEETNMKTNTIGLIGILAMLALYAVPQPAHAMYDAKHGRWMQHDPLGVRPDTPQGAVVPEKQYADGMGLHEYVGSRPIDATDPLGLQTVKVCIRPLRALRFTTVIVHCFLGVGDETYSYDNNGIHSDPKPDAWRTKCVTICCNSASNFKKKVNNDKLSGTWDGGDYGFFGHNCCHWADNVLREMGCNGVESYFPPYSLP